MIVQLLQRGSWGQSLADLGSTEHLIVAGHLIDEPHPVLWRRLGDAIAPPDLVGLCATALTPQVHDHKLYLRTIDDMMSSTDYGTSALETLAHTVGNDDIYSLGLEPLRWTLALYPRWHAQETRAHALPLLRAQAQALTSLGYSTWCEVTHCIADGRRQARALLAASRDRELVDPRADMNDGDLDTYMPATWLVLRQLVADDA